MATAPVVKFVHKTWASRARTVLALSILVPVILAAAFSPQPLPMQSWGHALITCAAWVLFMLGAVLRWWATLHIGGMKGGQVIQHGPYSVCRNPLYLGTFLMTVSVFITLQSVIALAALIVASAIYLTVTVPQEELRLGAHLGKEYHDYCARVPRFLPNWSLLQTPETLTVRTVGLKAEFKRSLRWAAIPIVCELVSLLRDQTWWPHLFKML